MIISTLRYDSDEESTLSLVFVDDKFSVYGLEDEHRTLKVAGETRIPAGRYKITVRDFGGFHGRYAKKFPDFHKGMLWIRDVPNFEYVLIHIGNTDDDTAGCLLVGSQPSKAKSLTVSNSTTAYKKLYKQVIQAALDDDLWIEIVDADMGAK